MNFVADELNIWNICMFCLYDIPDKIHYNLKGLGLTIGFSFCVIYK